MVSPRNPAGYLAIGRSERSTSWRRSGSTGLTTAGDDGQTIREWRARSGWTRMIDGDEW